MTRWLYLALAAGLLVGCDTVYSPDSARLNRVDRCADLENDVVNGPNANVRSAAFQQWKRLCSSGSDGTPQDDSPQRS